MISIMLVLALVMGCFAVMPQTAKAVVPIPYSMDDLTELVPHSAKEFTATGESGNGLNGPVTLWWDYHRETRTGDVYMLVASEAAGKPATATWLDGTKGAVIFGGDKKDSAVKNVGYSLVMFEGVWLTGTEPFIVSMNPNGAPSGGQTITGNLKDYFPQLSNIKYWDDTNPPVLRSFLTQVDLDIDLSGETTSVRSWPEEYTPPLGYKFRCWIDDNDVEWAPDEEIAFADDDVNLYAVWAPDYTVTNTLRYTVEYCYKDGARIDFDEFTGKVWVNDPQVLHVTSVDTSKYMPYGYKFSSIDTVLPADVTNNAVINVYYEPSTVKVTFLPGDAAMGYLVDANGDTIKAGTPKASTTIDVLIGTQPNRKVVPHPYAVFSYKFTGWYCEQDGETYKPSSYTNPTDVELPEVYEELTFIAQWAEVDPSMTFPDKIPSEQHFDRWWADYGIICFAASTTKDDMYTVMFADWFFDVYKTCTIGFGAPGKMDYEIRFTEDSVTLWQKTGNSWKQITNKGDIKYEEMTCIRDGHYYAKGLHNYGKDFGMDGTMQGVTFVNPFGSGAKLAWLY